jgi:hypothetical protein
MFQKGISVQVGESVFWEIEVENATTMIVEKIFSVEVI